MQQDFQGALFYESINDALRDVVRALGGAKKVGQAMRPEKMADDAARWVADCLNPERRERFDPEQVLWLFRKGREIGCHVAINYFCEHAGYSVPQPVAPEDQKAELQREFIEATKRMEQLARSIGRIDSNLKAVA